MRFEHIKLQATTYIQEIYEATMICYYDCSNKLETYMKTSTGMTKY